MTNNQELKKLMADIDELDQEAVAEYTDSSVDAVKGWGSNPASSRYRNMPPSKLKLLKLELRERQLLQD
ncbi:MAG: hypothetical protein V3T17_10685 [Pseudomonadales bacterium]